MKKSRLRDTVCAIALIVGMQTAHGFSVIDQSHTSGGDLGAFINECCEYAAQTFTAGVSGNLDSVRVSIGESVQAVGQLRISILPTQNGLPIFNPLGSITLSSASAALTDVIAFPNSIAITTGTMYAIAANYVNVPAPGAGQVQGVWSGSTNNQYTNGQYLTYYQNGWIYDGDGYDVHFQTYASPIPIPASIWLFGSGLLGLVGMARRKA